METVNLEVKIPSALLFSLQKSRKEIEQDFQRLLALHLFRERQISAGEAADLLGMTVGDFLAAVREASPFARPPEPRRPTRRAVTPARPKPTPRSSVPVPPPPAPEVVPALHNEGRTSLNHPALAQFVEAARTHRAGQ